MEVVPLLFAILLGIFLIAVGVLSGWNMAVRRFGGNAAEMAAEFEWLDEVAQRDPARMGIDIGKRYATDRVRETLRDIDAETE